MKSLTLQFVPYGDIEKLDGSTRIKKLLKIILQDKIILLQGKLKPEEEVQLIEETMELVGNSRKFKGIELATITSNNKKPFELFKNKIASLLIGERDSLTVIGPATLVKDIKRNPKKVELLLRKAR